MNLTRLKLDGKVITMPRGVKDVFQTEEGARAFFDDWSQYGRDCVGSGILWGSILTLSVLKIIDVVRSKMKKDTKSEEKKEEESEEEA